MGDKILVIGEKVTTLSGYYDVKKTYDNIMDYIENSLTYDPSVNDYDEKHQDGKVEINSSVEAKRKYNEIYKITLKFKIEFSGKNVEGEINGKKVIVQNGSGKLIMNTFLEPDWDKVREKSSLANFLSQVYQKFIGNDEQSKVEDAAADDVTKIIARFKRHFNATLK